ncbi:hypothetical protein NGB24_07120 [Mammaliicoccus vitulinus]|uniref:hypothetical protein n=1 Tax=Mammaliicoccus vitulinus TaxID=71237 RepID=UPI002DBE7063|nr:hypothetical protein [Mammaliicoccus vitulinus]MEB7657623.1 hypothetical protein [Mammaliicoccus vitulinus]
MKTIQKNTFNKSLTFEKQIAKQKWDKFKELIQQSGVAIKSIEEDTILLKIEGEERADIEMFSVHTAFGDFVHIQLWYYYFNSESINEKHRRKSNRYNDIPSAFAYINSIYEDIKMDKCTNEEDN